MVKTIGVLTGGGDVPGLNVAIQELTIEGIDADYRVLGIRRGWGGLVYMDPNSSELDNEHVMELTDTNVRRLDRSGGTVLHTSRVNPSDARADRNFQKYRGFSFEGKRDLSEDVLKNLENLGIDVLVAIGGDDTLSYARHLAGLGIKVIGIPKTMDGDVYGAGYCIGFSTAITRSNEFITNLRTSTGSHERVGIFEQFGRQSGLTALYSAVAASPDRVLIPEVDFDIDKVIELISGDYDANPSNYAILLVSEGAKPIGGDISFIGGAVDGFGHGRLGGIGKIIGAKFKEQGFEIIEEQLKYLIRCGAPDAVDKIRPRVYAHLAMNAILEGDSSVLTAMQDGKFTLKNLAVTKDSPLTVDVDRDYLTDKYRPNILGFGSNGLLL
ncbi:MAG: 6-phosphofructokinase [Nanoarchaeota archaeon]|nr:6-phosphofructokinase [Nanoarchaeota archaeon]